jgi:hypothetical protein
MSGGVHHWLKGRSTREERKPVTREHNNNNNNNNNNIALFTVNIGYIKHVKLQPFSLNSGNNVIAVLPPCPLHSAAWRRTTR